MGKLKIIVSGFIGLYPTGGVTWDYIQYVLGLKMLGHDVYYIEDTGQYSFYKSHGKEWDDPSDTIQYLDATMRDFGFENRWAYRDVATGKCFGMSPQEVKKVCETADIFINVSAASLMRDEYLSIPVRVLIDSDPMFTQVQDWDDSKVEESKSSFIKYYGLNYTHFFSFGENIGHPDCRIPTYGFLWQPTRQPVCLRFWEKSKIDDFDVTKAAFTTIMNWSTRKKMCYLNEEWGQKDMEFNKFIDIPLTFKNNKFDIIVADSSKKMDPKVLLNNGWGLLDPLETINTPDQYRNFIYASLGEFSVAKETYVKSKSGWFSCRSACYLAAGKPVITQDTQWSKYITSGMGLLAFSDQSTALNALEEVYNNYNKHSYAALEIAKEFFDSNKVLTDLINRL
ncbi:hypothetical protein [Cognataquiflexum rubidum]|uniref:hypothetical protein n=1 Tax=Cognataquiflexum rubidum TaxID=2922273 RepID=UPI001F138A3A|nr:hypothetical protein [Cognataquiflexum rubidum]MCH6235733.1 hypothetical protein [Cognataquiflexum rubidum]